MTAAINDSSLKRYTDEASRWDAVLGRDGRADGTFYFAVSTTGIYCRPSCPARHARRENVTFFETREAAEKAGYRACKRCKPDSDELFNLVAVRQACRMIEQSEELPSLEQLASAVGLSPFYFHKLFKSALGVTPKGYADARRTSQLQHRLNAGSAVTAAFYHAGFNSSSRFYSAAGSLLGMTPARYRLGGKDETIRFAVGASWLGAVLVAATDRGVCAILIGDDPEELVRDLQDRFRSAEIIGAEAGFDRLVGQVIAAVERPDLPSDLPLDIRGTAFQRRIWEVLRTIPVGETKTYSAIAEKIGEPKAVRAVASACAANPLAVAIPCHRVVRLDGSLSGYRWGIERKRLLLDREKRGGK